MPSSDPQTNAYCVNWQARDEVKSGLSRRNMPYFHFCQQLKENQLKTLFSGVKNETSTVTWIGSLAWLRTTLSGRHSSVPRSSGIDHGIVPFCLHIPILVFFCCLFLLQRNLLIRFCLDLCTFYSIPIRCLESTVICNCVK